ncbi:MAG: hypothetical protein ACTHWJ_09725 [Flaviflexus sp.]|uniref:hypothetical protein n=1 Tax=Flaviflexus sp. TaxID=1969482 RepID=UPI003F8E5EA7
MDIRDRIAQLNTDTVLDGNVLHLSLATDLPPSILWPYLTDPVLLRAWSPYVPDRVLTFEESVLARENSADEPYLSQIMEIKAEETLAHTWGDDTVRWSLTNPGITCDMTLQEPKYASYYAAGWQVCLAVLQALLEGDKQERIVGMDAMEYGWPELQKKYQAELPGQEAAPDEG